MTFMDPRSTFGEFSRGSNVYNGGTNNAMSTGYTRPQGWGGSTGWGGSGSTSSGTPTSTTPTGTSGGYVRPSSPAPTTTSPTPTTSSPDHYVRPSSPTVSPTVDSGGAVRQPGTWDPTYPGGMGAPTQMDPLQQTLTPEQDQQVAQILLQPLPPPPQPLTTDPQIEAARVNSEASIQQLEAQRQAAEQRITSQLEAIMERLGLQRERSLDSNEERMASQGIFRSGINTQEAGRIGEQYNQMGSDASMETGNAISQLMSDTQGQMTGIQNALRNAEAGFATRQEEWAQQSAAQHAAALQARMDALQQAMFGPVSGSGGMQFMGAPGAVAPSQQVLNPQLNYGSAPTADLSQLNALLGQDLQSQAAMFSPSAPSQDPLSAFSFNQINPAQSSSYGTAATLDPYLRQRLFGG